MNKSLFILTLSCVASAVAVGRSPSRLDGDETDIFDAPEVLLTDDRPFSGQMYPSPVLQDLDGDGKAELVVGDLPGRMRFATRKDKGLHWSKLNPMKSGDEPLRLNNW